MTCTRRAIIAITAIGTTIALAAYGDRISGMYVLGSLATIIAIQNIERHCRADEPTLYLAGVLYAGCPNPADSGR